MPPVFSGFFHGTRHPPSAANAADAARSSRLDVFISFSLYGNFLKNGCIIPSFRLRRNGHFNATKMPADANPTLPLPVENNGITGILLVDHQRL